MGKLKAQDIRKWMEQGEHFEGRGDGDNLWLRYRTSDLYPRWILRYSLGGKAKVLHLGSYRDLSVAEARARARKMRAEVALGYDVAQAKKERTKDARAKQLAQQGAATVAVLADEFFERYIQHRWKHPAIVRGWIDNRIKPAIGSIPLTDVKPAHVDQLLRAIAKNARTVSTKVLRCLMQIFNYGVKRGLMPSNPAAVFEPADAGGEERPRTRWLTKAELERLMGAMRDARGWNLQNSLTVKLLLMLAVRKSELIRARNDEFDFEARVWRLPAGRTKTSTAIDIPLSTQAVAALNSLIQLGGNSEWLLPARKMQTRMVPHIDVNTINAAMAKSIRPLMVGCDHFTVHDFRRTARTHLEALGVAPHVAERCLNHRLKGIVGIYNRYDYFEERRMALQLWANLLEEIEG